MRVDSGAIRHCPRPVAVLTGLALGVAALHALLLVQLMAPPVVPDPAPVPAPVLQTRVLSAPVPMPDRLTPSPPPRGGEGRGERMRRERPSPQPSPAPRERVPERPVRPPVPEPGAAPAAPAEPALPLPVYATALPPPQVLDFRLQRGALSGQAQLRWAPGADGRYDAALVGEAAAESVLAWRSRGGVDGAGIAPERFVASGRRGRGAQAANFQRLEGGRGKITYSGPQVEHPLPPGAQDRLSVLLQVGAVVAAAPGQFGPGAVIDLFVSGARGDAETWRFVVEGLEAVGAARALKLLREPRRPYDTRVELWLDPGLHYLPSRLRLSTAGTDRTLELWREDIQTAR